jgi:hypothetical protein
MNILPIAAMALSLALAGTPGSAAGTLVPHLFAQGEAAAVQVSEQCVRADGGRDRECLSRLPRWHKDHVPSERDEALQERGARNTDNDTRQTIRRAVRALEDLRLLRD